MIVVDEVVVAGVIDVVAELFVVVVTGGGAVPEAQSLASLFGIDDRSMPGFQAAIGEETTEPWRISDD